MKEFINAFMEFAKDKVLKYKEIWSERTNDPSPDFVIDINLNISEVINQAHVQVALSCDWKNKNDVFLFVKKEIMHFIIEHATRWVVCPDPTRWARVIIEHLSKTSLENKILEIFDEFVRFYDSDRNMKNILQAMEFRSCFEEIYKDKDKFKDLLDIGAVYINVDHFYNELFGRLDLDLDVYVGESVEDYISNIKLLTQQIYTQTITERIDRAVNDMLKKAMQKLLSDMNKIPHKYT